MANSRWTKNIVLTGDIGGTNTTLALVLDFGKIKNKKVYLTSAISDFADVVNDYLKCLGRSDPRPRQACFAVAGPVIENRGRLTNADLVIEAKEILKKTPIRKCLIINDFDAVSFSVESLKPSDIIEIKPAGTPLKGRTAPEIASKKSSASLKSNIVVIGAGTGLGKSLLIWNDKSKCYAPVPSEAGHSDIAVYSEEELAFLRFAKMGTSSPASWETVLSGAGLERIYLFLKAVRFKDFHGLGPSLSADKISQNRNNDPVCKETFLWFERFYARFAKNCALDAVARGGVYIAGGIVAKNPDMFTPAFEAEFINSSKLKELLMQIPVRAIINYDVSLEGCAAAMRVWKERAVSSKKG